MVAQWIVITCIMFSIIVAVLKRKFGKENNKISKKQVILLAVVIAVSQIIIALIHIFK